jgi:uncharacterized protein YbjT (DUF2867 family)
VANPRVCVAGATGYLGTRVVAALRSRGLEVTAIVRNHVDRPALRTLVGLGASIAAVDAACKESYEPELANINVAISCLASRNAGQEAANDFWAIDRDATLRFGRTAVACGVRHVILVATFEGPASRRQSEFSDAKEQAVDGVRLACETAHVALTVIRPTAYFSDLTDRAFESVAKHHRYTQIGDGSHRINPIDGDDVAEFIWNHLAPDGALDRDYPIGGPDIMTFHEIGCLAAECLGTQGTLRFRRIPVAVLRLLAALAVGAGKVSHRWRRSAAILNWMIYAGTHDAVAPSTGKRHLRGIFATKSSDLESRRSVPGSFKP